jgi:hypothetical protein
VNGQDGKYVQCVYFLSGTAGSGQSAAAENITQHSDQPSPFGSSFRFDYVYQVQKYQNKLFSTIALDIAVFDLDWTIFFHNAVPGKRTPPSTPP